MWNNAYCHSIRTEATFAEFSGGFHGHVWGSVARLNPACHFCNKIIKTTHSYDCLER